MSAEETRASVQRQLFLRTMNVARPTAAFTSILARTMRDAHFPAGAAVYREGEPADNLYFIVAGSVELHAPDKPSVHFGDRRVIGILDMLQDVPHTRTATARSDVHALVIRSEDWLELLEDNFDSARGAILNISAAALRAGKALGPDAGFDPPVEDGEPAPSRPLNVVERLLVLRALPALARVRIQSLTSLAEVAREVRASDGDVLFREHDSECPIFTVAHGLVEITSEDPVTRARFGPRSIVAGFGALAAVAGYTATARAPSVLLTIAREDLFDLMEDHFEVARTTLAYVATEVGRLGALRTARGGASNPPGDSAATAASTVSSDEP